MEKLNNIIKDKYETFTYKLEKDYDMVYTSNETFKKLADSLKLPKSYLAKYTSKLEDSARELDHCKHCKNLMECKNSVCGYVYYPVYLNDNLVFNYIACKYKKKMDKDNAYQDNVYVFDIPLEIRKARVKDIDTSDPKRVEVIRYIKNYLDSYKEGKKVKGLYLTGNFGCGKTYLLSAMLNELAMKGEKVAIIYYPEFLRKLKEGFSDDSYIELFNKVEKVSYLLLDDIGAETTTAWARDEILGTLLQYRMQEHLPTFFTSNLTLKELEEHLSSSSKGIEMVKARRIIERIKQLSMEMVMISENKRK